jgi:hypothetical protein
MRRGFAADDDDVADAPLGGAWPIVIEFAEVQIATDGPFYLFRLARASLRATAGPSKNQKLQTRRAS